MRSPDAPLEETPATDAERSAIWRRGLRRGAAFNVLFLAALVVALVFWIDPNEVWAALTSLPRSAFAAALLLAIACRSLMGLKWRQLIIAAGERITVRGAIGVYFQSGFASRLVPLGIGGDVLRGYLVGRSGVPAGVVLGSMAVEKLVAVLSTVVLAIIGALYLAARLPADTRAPLIILIAAGLLVGGGGLALLLYAPAHTRGAKLLRGRMSARFEAVLSRMSRALLEYGRRPRALVVNFLLAAMEQTLQILKLYVLGRGVGITVPVLPFIATLMVVLFARRVAGYVEGWGLAEGLSVLMLTLLGIGAGAAVALAAANFAVQMLAVIPGGYLLWRGRLALRGGPGAGERRVA